MGSKLKVFKGTRISRKELKYDLKNDDFLVIKETKFYVGVQPSFTIIEELNPAIFEDSNLKDVYIYKIRVRCDITRVIFNTDNQTYEKEIYKRDVNTTKTYHLSNDLLNEISKLQSFIKREIEQYDLSVYHEDFTIDFNKMDKYISIENPNNYSSEQIHNFLNMIDDAKDLNIGNSILMIKALTNFKNELLSVLDQNENKITAVFKKYKSVLSMILLGINSIPIFSHRIKTSNYKTVIPDITLFNEKDEKIHLIELKQAKFRMFKDNYYRNNTLEIEPKFFNAIHQTNFQRTMKAVGTNVYYETIPKSILIYGDIGKETELFKPKDVEDPEEKRKILLRNLNIIRHNNKDIIILTYDEFIEKIDILISNFDEIDKK